MVPADGSTTDATPVGSQRDAGHAPVDGGKAVVGTTTDAGVVTVEEFSLPSGSEPLGITLGADGNVWFIERRVDRIARMTASGTLSEFPMKTKGLSPEVLTTSHAGDVWYGAESMFGRVDTAGTLTEYPSTTFFFPYSMTVDSSDNLWFLDSETIWRRTPAGSLTPFSAPGAPGYSNDLSSLVIAADGNLWCLQDVEQNLLRMTPTGTYAAFAMNPPGFGLAAGPDGNLWATVFATSPAIVRQISTDGAVKNEYPVPGAVGSIGYISAGPDGALWFTEGDHEPPRIGRITTDGAVDEFVLPGSGTYMMGFAVTADGSLWFTEGDVDKIGRIKIRH